MAKIKANQLKLIDDEFVLLDSADETKKLDWELANITTATTRKLTAQDQDGVVSVQADQTLTQGSIGFADGTGKIAQDNLNFFYDDTNNRLGIGTATPGTLLQVAGLTTIGISTILADSIFINGNMGVGIDKLVIFGDDAVIGLQKSPHIIIHNEDKTTDNSGFIAWTSDNNTNNEVAYAAIDGIAGVRTSDWFAGELAFYTRTTLTNTLDERMRIDSTGNVGIGTNATTTTLDILGDSLLTNTATADNQMASQYMLDAAGFASFKGINMVYTTGAIVGGDRQAAFLIDIDASLATGGMFVALDVATIPGSSSVCAVEASAQVQPLLHLSGGFTNMDSALVNAIDRLTEFTSPGSDIAMFVADNDTVTIGNALRFQQMSFDLDTVAAGAGIDPLFEFSTGVGTWATFNPTDGTNGMRNSGNIIWRNSDIPSWAVGTGAEFLIRITRQRNALPTVPIENLVQISVITEYAWNADGTIEIAGLDIGFTTQVNSILDEDDMVSNSDQALATQQSIKAYVDNTIAIEDLWDRTLAPNVTVMQNTGDTLGIGTINPFSTTKVHIFTGSSGGTPSTIAQLVLEEDDNIALQFLVPNQRSGIIYFGDPENPISGSIAYTNATDRMVFTTDSVVRFEMSSAGVIVNETGAAVDFRVEGDTEPNLLQIDASTDRIGVGIALPLQLVHIFDSFSGITPSSDTPLVVEAAGQSGITIATNATGVGNIYFGDSADNDAGRIQYFHNGTTMRFTTEAVERMRFSTTEMVVNDVSIDYDFRVEGAIDVNLLLCDASTDRVGIGLAAPLSKLHVFDGTSGVTPSALSVLIIEDDTNTAMSFITPNTRTQSILFGDPELATQATISYNHATDVFNILTGVSSLAITSAKTHFNSSLQDHDFQVSGDTEANLIYADASTDRVGFATATPVTTVDINGGIALSIQTITDANHTALITDHTILMSTGATGRTVTLPTVATSNGLVLNIKKIDVGVGSVTVDGNGAETIDDATTQVLSSQFDSITIQCDGTEWWIL